MPRFGFVGPAYRSQSVSADCQTCMNLYPEAIESGQGASSMALYRTPGLNLLYSLGTAGVRGEITAQGRTFAVAGTQLWELLSPSASPNKIARGTVLSDGQPVSMAYGAGQGLIASEGTLYLYNGLTNTLSIVSLYDPSTGLGLLGPVSQVVYADGFFFALIANSNQIQCSNALDASTWQGVNETQVSVFSDPVTAIFTDHRLLWVFGPNNTQPYYDSGNSPFPYDVVQGGFIEQGIAAPNSIARLDNSIMWLGQDSRGGGIVWRANGYTPVRVSTHALEYELSTYTRIDDAVCYAYQDQGHTFYVMNFPTAQRTWVYDAETNGQGWHQRGFWNTQAGIFTQSRAGFHTFNFGMHLVGDPTTGSVYQQSIGIFSDFGNPIRRIRRAPHFSTEKSWVLHEKLQVDVETGVGPTFNGSAAPTMYALPDPNGGLHALSIGDGGIIQAPSTTRGSGVSVFINAIGSATSWQITIDEFGKIQPVQVVFNASYPSVIQFVTTLGNQRWNLQLSDLGSGIGVLQTTPLGMVGRGPLMVLRWSNDGGHTWSNEYSADCGQLGAYSARVIWRRLGRSRDRVYEISVTDPVNWAIVDAYLYTNPEDKQPKERWSSMARKQA